MRFDEICGNEHVKRAAEVALAGGHSIVLIGAFESQAADLFSAAYNLMEKLKPGRRGLGCRVLSPCPCGYCGDKVRECTCSLESITAWRIETWPVDTADITIGVRIPNAAKILGWENANWHDGEPDEDIQARIEMIDRAEVHPRLEETPRSLLGAAIAQLYLTPCHVRSISRVAVTIAALAGSTSVRAAHIAEAIQYRPGPEYNR